MKPPETYEQALAEAKNNFRCPDEHEKVAMIRLFAIKDGQPKAWDVVGITCQECHEDFFNLLYPDKDEMIREVERELEALKKK